jgi:hypothetical protein
MENTIYILLFKIKYNFKCFIHFKILGLLCQLYNRNNLFIHNKQYISEFSSRKHRIIFRVFYVGFVVDKVALE